jgi:hypothetical protein
MSICLLTVTLCIRHIGLGLQLTNRFALLEEAPRLQMERAGAPTITLT